jgi:hypothetical protein
MKLFTNLCAVAALILVAQLANAQTVNKGAWMLGGDVSLNIYSPDEGDSQTSWRVSPTLANYIGDDLAIGANITAVDFGEFSDTHLSIGPLVRYYVTNPIFIQVSANFGISEGAGSDYGAWLGYSWFVNSNVAIEPALYFRAYSDNGGSDFGLSIGIQAFNGRN